MPFYLVTHTALAEADDEVGAAKKVLAKLQSDPRVAFTVKFDEGSIKKVTIQRCDEQVPVGQPDMRIVAGTERDMPVGKIDAADQLAVKEERKTMWSAAWRGVALLAVTCFVGGLFFLGSI